MRSRDKYWHISLNQHLSFKIIDSTTHAEEQTQYAIIIGSSTKIMKTDTKVVEWLNDWSRWSRPKLTAVLCCDSHEFVAAEDARPPTTLPPPTYVHTYTLAVTTPTLSMFWICSISLFQPITPYFIKRSPNEYKTCINYNIKNIPLTYFLKTKHKIKNMVVCSFEILVYTT